ncbi:uncharacterized protein V6R79_021595 [Siganus canaliculatus]
MMTFVTLRSCRGRRSTTPLLDLDLDLDLEVTSAHDVFTHRIDRSVDITPRRAAQIIHDPAAVLYQRGAGLPVVPPRPGSHHIHTARATLLTPSPGLKLSTPSSSAKNSFHCSQDGRIVAMASAAAPLEKPVV